MKITKLLIHVTSNLVWSTEGYSVSSVCSCSLRYRDRNGVVTVQIMDGISTNMIYAGTMRLTTKRCYNCPVPDADVETVLERILAGYEALSGKPCQIVNDTPTSSTLIAQIDERSARFQPYCSVS